MANFKINGKEHDLKLTWAGVKYLNKVTEGGALAVVGQALQGDADLFPHVITAALKHTELNHSLEDVEQAIDMAVEEERLDFLEIMRISNEIIADSFFYKTVIDKMMAENSDAKTQLDKLLK